jgi:hypothetical protein
VKCKPENIFDAGLGICPRADKRADHECAVAGAVRSCAPSCCWPGAQLEPQENVEGQLVRAAVDDLRHGGAHLLEVASFTRQLAHQGLHTQQKNYLHPLILKMNKKEMFLTGRLVTSESNLLSSSTSGNLTFSGRQMCFGKNSWQIWYCAPFLFLNRLKGFCSALLLLFISLFFVKQYTILKPRNDS